MDVLITTGKDGVLTIHRETCKKISDRETQGVDEVLDTNPGALTTAKKASCCKPADSVMEEVEQAGWDTLERQADPTSEDYVAPSGDEDVVDPGTDGDAAEAGDDEDLIGDLSGEDLIGTTEQVETKPVKVSTEKSKARTEAREVNGAESLQKVAEYLGLDLGVKPKFPGFGRAFKTAAKQSIYINSKGNADVRAKDDAEATEFAGLEHVERRAGNYVRVNLAAL